MHELGKAPHSTRANFVKLGSLEAKIFNSCAKGKLEICSSLAKMSIGHCPPPKNLVAEVASWKKERKSNNQKTFR
jgi:hypothetical protein